LCDITLIICDIIDWALTDPCMPSLKLIDWTLLVARVTIIVRVYEV